ncbi:Qat anti-phage system associated protein QatB [Acidiphilium acidophilum]|uniref:Qat anti-phage system associated protein QatB n=1 Tax=Acidiphilium acidophilum TaxID=76588 RepID=UPI002E8E63FC|nr:Qat anti-phage system associated protein QatB [Acidiphilium acidophilum]
MEGRKERGKEYPTHRLSTIREVATRPNLKYRDQIPPKTHRFACSGSTIADLAGAGITDIDALTPGQIQTVFELYATHAIEARICNDVGTKVVTLPADSRAAERVQAQLRDFIQRGVSDAINAAGVNIQSLTPDAVMGFVTNVYQSAFEVLQTMGDGEAAK